MDKVSASEALFGFVGWLTSLETPVTFSACHRLDTAAELVSQFCKANNFAKPRDDWYENLVYPASRPIPDAVDDQGSSDLQALFTPEANPAPEVLSQSTRRHC